MSNSEIAVSQRTKTGGLVDHLILLCGIVFLFAPIWMVFCSSTHTTATLQKEGLQWWPSTSLLKNYQSVFSLQAGASNAITAIAMLKNSLIVAVGAALMTTVFSWLFAYALVFCKLKYAGALFSITMATLLFPLEARFINTYEVVTSLGLVNTHFGIILPVLSTALGTLFFRQHFLSLPKHLIEAAMLDGAGPTKFMIDIVMPLSLPRLIAIFVVSFIIGWNQYLWPLMVTSDENLFTLVRGVRFMGQESGPGMALLMVTIIPPMLLLLIFKRWILEAFSNTQ